MTTDESAHDRDLDPAERRRREARERRLARSTGAAEQLVAESREPRLRAAAWLIATSAVVVVLGLLLPAAWSEGTSPPLAADAFAIPETATLRWIAAVTAVMSLVLAAAVPICAGRRDRDTWLTAGRVVVTSLAVLLAIASLVTQAGLHDWDLDQGPSIGLLVVMAGAIGLGASALWGYRADAWERGGRPGTLLRTRGVGVPDRPLDDAAIGRVAEAVLARIPEPAEADEDRGRRATTALRAVSAAGLVAAAVLTLAPWIRYDFPALDRQIGGVGDTHHLSPVTQATGFTAARPALLLALVAVAMLIASVAVPLLRRHAAAVSAAGALGVGLTTWRAASGIAAAGVGTSTSVALGPVLVMVLAALAVVTGVAATVAAARTASASTAEATDVDPGADERGRHPARQPSPARALIGPGALLAAALVVAVVVPLDDPTASRSVGPFEWVLGGQGDAEQWGTPATDFQIVLSTQSSAQESRPAVALDDDEPVALLVDGGSDDLDSYVASVIDGRVVPRTNLGSIDHWYEHQLIGTVDDRALIRLYGRFSSGVVSVDLREPQVYLPSSLDRPDEPPGDDSVRVLVELGEDDGTITDVTAQADGSLVVRTRDLLDYRIPATTVRRGEAWSLDDAEQRTADYGTVAYDEDGTRFEKVDGGTIVRIDPDGDEEVVLGGSPDPRCRPSTEVTNVHLPVVRDLALDARGNLWIADSARLVERTGRAVPNPSSLLVLEPDGTLRVAPAPLGSVVGIVASPDGSIWLSELTGALDGRVLRLPDAVEAVERFPLAGSPAEDCPTQPDIDVETAGLPVEVVRRGLLADQGTLYRPDGTVAYQDRDPDGGIAVTARRPDGREEVLGRVGLSHGVLADGQGGVWALGTTPPGEEQPARRRDDPATFVLSRLDAGQRDGTWPLDEFDPRTRSRTSTDPSTGELLLSSIGGDRWRAYSGATSRALDVTTSATDRAQVWSRGDAMFVADGGILSKVEADGAEIPWMGGEVEREDDGTDSNALDLDVALAGDASAQRVSPQTVIGLDPDGRPMLLSSGYLARVDAPGALTALAGPDDGMPRSFASPLLVGDELYGLSNGRLLRVRLP